MLYGTILWVIVSLVLIILIHNIYSFFKNTLTVPKVKDLVNRPTQRYNEILSTINNENAHNANTSNTNSSLTQNETKEMKDELKHFLDELKISGKNSGKNTEKNMERIDTTNISDLNLQSNNIQASNEIAIGGTSTEAFSNF